MRARAGRRRASRGAARNAPRRRPGPASTIASATFSGFDTIQRVSQRSRSSACGNPSVAMNPGSTMPTCTPWARSSRCKASVQTDQGELAGRVRARVPARDSACRAGHVHDRARGGAAQERQQRLREPHRRIEIQLHVAAHVLPPDITEPPAPRRAGVVHEQVQAAVLLFDRARDARRRLVVAQVGGEHGRAAELVGERAQQVLAARDEYQRACPARGRAAARSQRQCRSMLR